MTASRKVIAHVAQIDLGDDTGMGRIASHWIDELRRRGHDVFHVGAKEVGPVLYSGLFPYKARRLLRQRGAPPDLVLVHEPAAGPFISSNEPVVVFSHGLERRNWEQRLGDPRLSEGGIRLRTRVLFPLWRLKSCDRGLRRASKVLLSSEDDREFARRRYGRRDDDLYVFKNGADVFERTPLDKTAGPPTVLFNGTWVKRKGTETLVEAARLLDEKGVRVRWLLIGTKLPSETIRRDFPARLAADLEIHPVFERSRERDFLSRASVFVLPSLFEGQPLSLVQAMAAGLCCVASRCCGQKDLIEDGRTGALFEPGDALGFAAVIQKLVADPSQRELLGRGARAAMKERTWAKAAAETADWLEAQRLF